MEVYDVETREIFMSWYTISWNEYLCGDVNVRMVIDNHFWDDLESEFEEVVPTS